MIWLIGVGYMGIEYAKVLDSLKKEHIAIGKGEKNAAIFTETTRHEVVTGGLFLFLSQNPPLPESAIVAASAENLAETAAALMQYGVKKILLEKPGAMSLAEINSLLEIANKTQSLVQIAYNRRFYSSTLKAEEIIKADGGVTSFHFEFTEWAHIIENLNKPQSILANWFLGNSTHVVDLAFFLGGVPKEMKCFTIGELLWHKPAIFSGAGITNSNVLFSYHANWRAPGRWSVELLTSKHRLYFKPMETLQIQKTGSVTVEPVEIDDRLDKDFKPGLFLQTQAFINNDYTRFCSLKEQRKNFNFYMQMLNKNQIV
ncbi:MAG: Gfo/Idh/MocA family oxidoreductase [Prevotellaceae bacterium]|jgi:predicted dehydrogenase|nr:Gfo/Idh/MocA family oxidoreductase [Prevotellaceae bacterium]